MADCSDEFRASGRSLITDRHLIVPIQPRDVPIYQGDPGDENDFVEPEDREEWEPPTHDTFAVTGIDEPSMDDYPDPDGQARRSYTCTWVSDHPSGKYYRTDTIMGYDSFAATAALAAGLAREGETVIGLSSI